MEEFVPHPCKAKKEKIEEMIAEIITLGKKKSRLVRKVKVICIAQISHQSYVILAQIATHVVKKADKIKHMATTPKRDANTLLFLIHEAIIDVNLFSLFLSKVEPFMLKVYNRIRNLLGYLCNALSFIQRVKYENRCIISTYFSRR